MSQQIFSLKPARARRCEIVLKESIQPERVLYSFEYFFSSSCTWSDDAHIPGLIPVLL